MSELFKKVYKSQVDSVEYRYAGSWPVYGDYDLAVHQEEGERHVYVVRTNFDEGKIWWSSPLREPGLFIEFAELFDQMVPVEEAAPTVLDWVRDHGALGANYAYSDIEGKRRAWSPPDGHPVKAHGTAGAIRPVSTNIGRLGALRLSFSGTLWSPPDDIQWVEEFVMHSVIANRCWRLLAAAKARGGPDAEKLRELLQDLDVKGDTPAQLAKRAKSVADSILNFYLRRETCVERYSLGDGKSVRGPGFLSLLGALYLQMSNFRDAEDITYCKWCGKVVDFEQGEPPPSDAPKGARGKHKTHSNREYCIRKYGVENYCKNQFNNDQRKKAKERA
jgi:hypothetical protein